MTLLPLSSQEHSTLEHLVARTKHATPLRRAQALLWLDAGESVQAVAQRLRVTRPTVYTWVNRFQGHRERDLMGRLSEGARSGRPRTARGIVAPLIDAVIDRDPRDFGYRDTVWTAGLLRQYLHEVPHLAVSRKRVSFAIARLRLRWKRPRHDLSRRAAGWRQAKGGSNVACETEDEPSS